MKSFLRSLALAAILSGLILPVTTFAQTTLGGEGSGWIQELHRDSQPPDLGVPIPGLSFSTPTEGTLAGKTYLVIPWLAQYIAAAYRYAVGIGTIVAIIMVMYGGFRYLIASGGIGDVKRGKEIIKDAIVGLIILMGAYVLLQTVNPATLDLSALKIPVISLVDTPDEGDINDNPTQVNSSCTTGVVCTTQAECLAFCKTDNSTWPSCSKNAADVNAVQSIPKSAGVVPMKALKATPDLIQALAKAGAEAAKAGYEIHVTSAWRDMATQERLMCENLDKGGIAGNTVARAGGSNHGSGKAIDVQLWKGTDKLVSSGSIKAPQTQADTELLLKFMSGAGFKRYTVEVWHFEYGAATTACRCSSPSDCVWPPPPKCK